MGTSLGRWLPRGDPTTESTCVLGELVEWSCMELSWSARWYRSGWCACSSLPGHHLWPFLLRPCLGSCAPLPGSGHPGHTWCQREQEVSGRGEAKHLGALTVTSRELTRHPQNPYTHRPHRKAHRTYRLEQLLTPNSAGKKGQR